MTPKLIFLWIAFFSATGWAQIIPHSVRTSGTGCPQGSTASAVTPDGSSLALLFDQLQIELPSVWPRKFCDVNLTFMVPKNRRLRTVSVDYRGAAEIAAGHQAELLSVIFVQPHKGMGAGLALPDMATKLVGPNSQELRISQRNNFVKSPCGQWVDVKFRSTISLERLDPQATEENSILVLDSADVGIGHSGPIALSLGTESCS